MPGFFSNSQKTIFKIDDYDYVEAIDLTVGFKVREFIQSSGGISYIPYVVQDGERPDNVANKVYDDPTLDWVVLIANNIHDIYDEWPKDSETFKQYIIEKYGTLQTAMSTVKYYYDGSGNIINQTDWNELSSSTGKRTESEYQYETRLNINKSKIRLFRPSIAKSMGSLLRNIDRKPIV